VRVLINQQRCMLSDVLRKVDRQRIEAYQAAREDRLTGLPNRLHAMERLQGAADQAETDASVFAVLFLDFDRFKVINDSLGHDTGDALLVMIAARLRQTLTQFTGQSDTDGRWLAARLGGDEFMVLLERTRDAEEPAELANALLKAMDTPYELGPHEVTSSPSIGVTNSATSKDATPGTMLRDADAAMYAAKRAGRNRYVMFDHTLHDQSVERLHIENQLRRALEDRTQLAMHYQPIVASESGQVVGFESLMRWLHPEMGLVSPGVFIPVAEETGQITALGRYALETGMRQMAAWRRELGPQRPLYMSINVSKRQMLQPDFLDHLQDTLMDSGARAGDINLEITETCISDRSDAIVPLLKRLKAMGFMLSMDDFGTGMSSLTCLHRYPIDVLKIDRGFVQQLEQRTAYSAVVQAVVTLARNLGMSVTVEGVEHVEQLTQIQALDCSSIQGFLFSRPVPAEDAGRMLHEGLDVLSRSAAA